MVCRALTHVVSVLTPSQCMRVHNLTCIHILHHQWQCMHQLPSTARNKHAHCASQDQSSVPVPIVYIAEAALLPKNCKNASMQVDALQPSVCYSAAHLSFLERALTKLTAPHPDPSTITLGLAVFDALGGVAGRWS